LKLGYATLQFFPLAQRKTTQDKNAMPASEVV
jgi:hypothetical protein